MIKKLKKQGKILAKPKIKIIRKLDPVKVAIKAGEGHTRLVSEGVEGHFNREIEKEIKWLNK